MALYLTYSHKYLVGLVLFALFLSGCTTAVVSPTALLPTSVPTALNPTVTAAAPTQPAATPSPVPPTSTLSPTATAAATQATSFTDPFAYCAAVGDADQPDASYTGPRMPDAIATGIKKASGAAPDAPLDLFRQNSFWRCMDHKVYGCTVGANLPCQAKANTDKTPTAAESDYCASNPTSDFIPAYITSHETIYSWRCASGKAVVDQQVFKVDARGFIADIWYLITPLTLQ